MEVIGIKDVNFKTKDGDIVQGVRLYVTDDSVKVNAGVACDTLFLSCSLLDKMGITPDDLRVGDHLTVSYNKFGKIQSIFVN